MYGKNVAYEYIAASESALCMQQVLSVTTETCRSCNASHQLAEYSNDHQESFGLHGNQNSVIQDKIDGRFNFTTRARQKCCLSYAVPDNALNGYAENKPDRVDVMHKYVPEEEPDSDSSAVEKQLHAVTHECQEGNLKKRQCNGSGGSSTAIGKDLKAELLEKVKFHDPCNSELILCNDSASLKCSLRPSSPERSLEKSLNIINKTEHLVLKFEESLSVENVDGLQTVRDTVAGGQTKTDNAIQGKLTTGKSEVVTFGNSHNICISNDSACCDSVGEQNGLSESELHSNLKDDRITQHCGAKSCDTSLPELISDNEWIASQSCFVLSESTGYITCDDTYPVVTRTDMDEDTNCLKGDVYNTGGKTSPSLIALVPSSPDTDSFVSLSEEYKYSDEDGGVVLLERRFLVPAVR